MKNLFLLLIISVSSSAFAVTGQDLISAREAAFNEARVEFNLDEISAFKIVPESAHGIEVTLRTKAEDHAYDCHRHGTDMVCHEAGHGHLKNKNEDEGEFDHLLEGHKAAISKLEKTLKRRGSGLDILESVKTWKLENAGSGSHDHGDDIWTKVKYTLNNTAMIVYVQCHEHGHSEEASMACHYKRAGHDEPTFE